MKFSLAIIAAAVAGASAQYANTTSVVTITTCVPTTILSTMTIAPVTTAKPATISAVGTGASTGGVKPTSTAISPSITPFTGAASNVAGSMAGIALAAAAAIVLA